MFAQSDNYRAMGALANYAEAKRLDLSDLDLNQLRASLDKQLNEGFQLGNIMVFLKLHLHVFASRFHRYGLSPSEMASLPAQTLAKKMALVFKDEPVVDMSSLFGMLVERLGDR